MTGSNILLPTDFSHSSDAALAYATALARDAGATLLVLHVEEPPAMYVGEMYYGAPEPDRAELESMLSRVVPADPNVPCEHRLAVGPPADVIVETARAEGAQLIVMGTHGRRGLGRLLLGSVAEEVVRRAPCPVFTLKAAG